MVEVDLNGRASSLDLVKVREDGGGIVTSPLLRCTEMYVGGALTNGSVDYDSAVGSKRKLHCTCYINSNGNKPVMLMETLQ